MCAPADDRWSCEGAQTSYAAEKKAEENDCRKHAGTFLEAKVLWSRCVEQGDGTDLIYRIFN
jgi:hypothetical protein